MPSSRPRFQQAKGGTTSTTDRVQTIAVAVAAARADRGGDGRVDESWQGRVRRAAALIPLPCLGNSFARRANGLCVLPIVLGRDSGLSIFGEKEPGCVQ